MATKLLAFGASDANLGSAFSEKKLKNSKRRGREVGDRGEWDRTGRNEKQQQTL